MGCGCDLSLVQVCMLLLHKSLVYMISEAPGETVSVVCDHVGTMWNGHHNNPIVVIQHGQWANDHIKIPSETRPWTRHEQAARTCARIPFAGSSLEFGSCLVSASTGGLKTMAAESKWRCVVNELPRNASQAV